MINTKTKTILFLILSSLFCNSACSNQTVSSQISNETLRQVTPKPLEILTQSSESNNEELVSIEDIVAEQDSLKYGGYEVKQLLTKKKYDNDSPVTDIADVVLQKDGKTLLKFEGTYYPLGNQIKYGFFPFLGNNNKQLIIYENSMRYGRVWIVNLSLKPKVLFDSKDWGDIREFVYIDDTDNNGNYEILVQKEESLSFEDTGIAHVHIPQIGFNFKYDNKTERFLPNSHKFENSFLAESQERISKTKTLNNVDGENLTDFIVIFLSFIYEGKEKEAWDFFDKEYNLEDKETRKDKIKVSLKQDPIYKFINNAR